MEVLRVEHVIVCGHYGCGGVEHAFRRGRLGLIDNWLCHVQDVHERHKDRFNKSMTQEQSVDRLCELNVIEQAMNVARSTVLQEAWRRGQSVAVHGWVYRLRDGLVRDLGFSAGRESEVDEQYEMAVRNLASRQSLA